MPNPRLGIMALYINSKKQLEELSFFKKLILAGKKMGIDVFVFTPEDVNAQKKQMYVLDYDPNTSSWKRRWTSFPALVYDRCRYQSKKRFQLLRKFRSQYPNLTYLNRPMANKWAMYQVLKQKSTIRRHLPNTQIYTSSKDLFHALKERKLIFLKPINGTGGRGILRIERIAADRYSVAGRDSSRRIIASKQVAKTQLVSAVKRWNLSPRYLIQQGIQLKLANGRVHDYRLLIQKNKAGEWEVTGCVGRVGAAHSITSNLHGGGKAVSMDTLLQEWIDTDKINTVKQTTYQLAKDVAIYLESHYGKLCELALDLAIDKSGDVWLLEVNQKPSREVFARIGEKETYRKAIARPLEYALWLYEKNLSLASAKKGSPAKE